MNGRGDGGLGDPLYLGRRLHVLFGPRRGHAAGSVRDVVS